MMATAREYGPKSEGALWPHEKGHEKQPDFRGHLDLSRAQLHALVDLAKQDSSAATFKLQLGVWDRTSRDGDAYKYIQSEVVIPGDENQGQRQQPRQYSKPTPPAAKEPWD